MSDTDTDSEVIAADDLIIIKEVKARHYLYNPNAIDIVIRIKERRSDSFKSIAKKIEKEIDLEFTGDSAHLDISQSNRTSFFNLFPCVIFNVHPPCT